MSSISSWRICQFSYTRINCQRAMVSLAGFEPAMTRGLSSPHMPFCYRLMWWPWQESNLQTTRFELA